MFELRVSNKNRGKNGIVTENITSYICIVISIYHYSLDLMFHSHLHVSLHFFPLSAVFCKVP